MLYSKLRERHQVKVISFKRQYPRIFFPGRTQQDFSQDVDPIESEPLVDSINPISWVRTFLRIKMEKPDLLIFKYWMPFFAPCYASILFLTRLFTITKSLFICDNIIPHERRGGDLFLTRLALRFVDYFIVQSKVVRDDLLRFRPDADYREVPHPVYSIFKSHYSRDQAREKLGIHEERVILFFGYVRAYKGLEYLIRALPLVLEKVDVKLVVAGEFYEDRGKYERLIKGLGLGERVLLVDRYVPNEEVGVYFSVCDVVVLPYVSATQSGILQIAYNFNKPVITTAVGGLPEVVGEGRTGFIVPPKDPEALAGAILRFFEEGAGFSENIAREKEKYSWDKMVEAVESLVGS